MAFCRVNSAIGPVLQFVVICECPKHQGPPNSLQAIGVLTMLFARFCQADAEPLEFSVKWLQSAGACSSAWVRIDAALHFSNADGPCES